VGRSFDLKEKTQGSRLIGKARVGSTGVEMAKQWTDITPRMSEQTKENNRSVPERYKGERSMASQTKKRMKQT